MLLRTSRSQSQRVLLHTRCSPKAVARPPMPPPTTITESLNSASTRLNGKSNAHACSTPPGPSMKTRTHLVKLVRIFTGALQNGARMRLHAPCKGAEAQTRTVACLRCQRAARKEGLIAEVCLHERSCTSVPAGPKFVAAILAPVSQVSTKCIFLCNGRSLFARGLCFARAYVNHMT